VSTMILIMYHFPGKSI